MILTTEDNVKVICWNYRGDGCCDSSPLSDFLKYKDLGDNSYDHSYRHYYYSKGPFYNNTIYLGSIDNVKSIFKSKLINTFPSTVKKVNFAPTCKYPRFKLSQLSDIKRVLDPSKADVGILSEFPNISTYNVLSNMCDMDTQVIIGYSQSMSCYIYLDLLPNRFYDTTTLYRFNKAIRKTNKGNAVNSKDELWNVLVNYGTIPSDTKIIYNGEIVFGTKNECLTLEYIQNKYMQIVYDTELDRIINATSSIPTDDDFKSLHTMLTSKDDAIIGMGLKLLSSYNIQERLGSVTFLLATNWRRIKNVSTINSVGFKNVLNVLKLDLSDFNYHSLEYLLGKVYTQSTNKDDREMMRNRIVEYVADQLSSSAISYKNEFDQFNLNIDIKVC